MGRIVQPTGAREEVLGKWNPPHRRRASEERGATLEDKNKIVI